MTELEALPAWRRFHALRGCTRAPGGEGLADVQVRMVTLLERLAAAHPDHTLALFSHSDPIKAALCSYLGVPLDLCCRLEISPASVTTLRVDGDRPLILCVNQTAGPGR